MSNVVEWEYRVETMLLLDAKATGEALNSLGTKGWELVCFIPAGAQSAWQEASRDRREKLYDELIEMNDPSPEDAFQPTYDAILKRPRR